jgi:hypothetical protein
MPNAVLEAMAAGLPVVTTAVGGVRDFAVDGRDALLLESVEPRRIADAIERLASQPELRSRLGLRGRELARRYFVSDVVGARLARVLEAFVARGGSCREPSPDLVWFREREESISCMGDAREHAQLCRRVVGRPQPSTYGDGWDAT